MSISLIGRTAFGVSFVFSLFMFAVSAGSVSAATNLISNPSFETAGPANWTTNVFGTNDAAFSTTSPGYTGTNAALVTITSYTDGDGKWVFDEVPVTPSHFYHFSNWYKSTIPTELYVEYRFNDLTTSVQWLADVPAAEDWTALDVVEFQVPTNLEPGKTITHATIFHSLVGVGTLTTDDYALEELPNTSFANGMVSLSFDDGWKSIYTNGVLGVLNPLNLKSTQYLNAGPILGGFTDYMTQSDVAALQAAGHDIGSHTRTHPHLTTLDDTQLTAEVAGNKADLLAMGAMPVDNFAYPYGEFNAAVKAKVEANHLGARGTEEGFNRPDTDRYELRMQEVGTTTTFADIQGWIDMAAANKWWLILMFHQIEDTCPTTPEFDFCSTTALLQSVANHLVTQNIPVVTVSQGIAMMVPVIPNTAPSFTSSAPTSVSANSTYTYNITTTDAEAGDTLSVISVNALPAWLALVDNGNRTATLSGTPADADVGNVAVTLRVSDGALSADQSFTIAVGPDAAPTLAEVNPVPTPTNDTTPSYTFSSNEAGVITYGGSCTATETNAVVGNNTITLNTLTEGTYSNCTITVADAHAHASAPLAVSAFTIDTTKPVIVLTFDAPPYDTATIGLNTGTSYNELGATATDNVDTTLAVVVGGDVVNTALPGTYVVRYNVSDDAGNAALEVIRTINVSDSTSPQVIGSNVTAEAADANGAIVNYPAPSVTDDIDSGLVATCTPSTGAQFSLGTTVVSCSATDNAGNVGVGSFNVTVVDTTAPVIATPIADQTFEATSLLTTPILAIPSATDTVDSSVTPTAYPASFLVGTTVVTWTATDDSGNASTAPSNVTITDTTAPTIALTGESVTFVLLNSSYTEEGAVATDLVDGSFAATPSGVVDAATEGTYIVTYNATDVAGNAATPVERTVVVSDLEISGEQSGNVGDDSVTITWSTTHPATSRVVYDAVSHNPLSGVAPNYGYADSTSEDTELTTEHSVVVSGLDDGTTYFFRAVSHGSPEVLGDEMSAKTEFKPEPSSSGGNTGGGGGGGGGGNGAPVGLVGGSSGGSVLGVSVVAVPQGSVLGAATTTATTGAVLPQSDVSSTSACFVFTHALVAGMSGAEVTELQKILIAKGYLTIAAPTGYFGPMTKAAVEALQNAHGLTPIGGVGPKTRAILNDCGSSAAVPAAAAPSDDVAKQAMIESLQNQVKLLNAQIQALIAATIDVK